MQCSANQDERVMAQSSDKHDPLEEGMANHPVYLPREPHELYKGFLSTLHTKPLFAPMVPSTGNGWSSYPYDWLLFSLFRSRFRCYLLGEDFPKHCSFSSSTQLILCPVTWAPWYCSAFSYGIYVYLSYHSWAVSSWKAGINSVLVIMVSLGPGTVPDQQQALNTYLLIEWHSGRFFGKRVDTFLPSISYFQGRDSSACRCLLDFVCSVTQSCPTLLQPQGQ